MAVVIEGLSYAYQDASVLHDINLDIAEGRFTIILGKNGSGKSTLLKLVAGMLKPQRGTIAIMGQEVGSLSMGERARLVGYLPQFHQPVFPFTVEEVVLTGRASYVFSIPSPRDREKARRAIAQVGIEELRTRPYTDLSGGERQLVMIARVLAQEPRIILLDEPISHLDLANQARFLKLVQSLVKSGLTVLAVLHDPNPAFLYGEEFVFLKDGSARKSIHADQAWDPSLLSQIYGIGIEVSRVRDRVFVTPCPEETAG
ncbi:MAG: ABC transporter ATP-binding protein [candidate division NC10 bacterium]|nr:ABC transporter ATP-binding protein [candidate division NC10 bacterium]